MSKKGKHQWRPLDRWPTSDGFWRFKDWCLKCGATRKIASDSKNRRILPDSAWGIDGTEVCPGE